MNPEKTQLMLFGNDKQIGKVENLCSVSISLENSILKLEKQCKSLGLTIDKNLNFAAHINKYTHSGGLR